MLSTFEDRIDTFYQQHNVTRPTDVSLLLWEDLVHVRVTYRPGKTVAATVGDNRAVFMDGGKPLPDRRAELAHEIGHALLHAGNQTLLDTTTRHKQEWQANHFAYYALVPTYLLLPYITPYEDSRQRLIAELADVFCVPLPFMATRLDLLQERLEAERCDRVAEMATKYAYTRSW